MATETLTLILETELLCDVVDSFGKAHAALAKRHGASFRRLERRIERIVEGERAIHQPELRALGDGRFVVVPPREMLDVVDEAARLGVI